MQNANEDVMIPRKWSLIIDFIKNVGFPIGVAVYLLWYMGDKVEKLTNAIQWQTVVMRQLYHSLEQHRYEAERKYVPNRRFPGDPENE